MHLVQLLIPVYDRGGARFPQAHYDTLARELTERFGGLTACVRVWCCAPTNTGGSEEALEWALAES